MRWLRDNWIDALIFAVFAVTVVGIVLFLTGVNPFKSQAPSGVTAPAGVETPAVGEPPAQADEGTAAEEPVTVVPLLPSPPAAEEPAPPAPQPEAGTQEPEPAPTSPSEAPAPRPAPAPAVPAGPESGTYRVSVGAFGNPLNALALAQRLQEQGYPVRLEPVGRVTRVVVGPYGRRSAAQAAAAKLSHLEPQVYRGDSPEPGQGYLQVGAFRQLASAEATVAALREQGIGPVVLHYRDPWIKVWVGPVEPGETAALKQKLKDAGFEVVEVR